MRVIFLCPADDTPTGGVKVIYRHCEVLNALGVDAVIMHPFNLGFRCNWFSHSARFADGPGLDPRQDFVIIPELWALPFGRQCLDAGVLYGIFVQNGYLTHAILPAHTPEEMTAVYVGAALILSISHDTGRMLRCNYPRVQTERILPVRYSIGANFHALPDRPKQRPGGWISLMPRKLPDHAGRIIFALRSHLPPSWHMLPILNVPEDEVANCLLQTKIFMSLSHFEGLPLPPLEAAIAGNFVIGYTGQGAKEYWNYPSFLEIQHGDIIAFVDAIVHAAAQFDNGLIDLFALQDASTSLARRYSDVAEMASLAAVAVRIAQLLQGANAALRAGGWALQPAYAQ